MNRTALGLLGVAVLAVSAQGIHRELAGSKNLWPSADAAPTRFRFTEHAAPRPLPDVRFRDGEGRAMSLSDFRGRVVLLNLWATWCPPCRQEMPTLDRLQKQLGGAEFEVLALSIDRGGAFAVKSFYDDIGIEALRVYVDATGDAAVALGAIGIPTTLLIDRQGREIGRMAGPAEWDGPAAVGLVRRHLGAGGR